MRRARRVGLVAGIAVVMLLVGGLGLTKIVRPVAQIVVARPATSAASSLGITVGQGGSMSQIIESLQNRLRQVPRDWRSWADLGMAYVQQARITADPTYYPKALGVLEHSLKLNTKENVDADVGMGALAAARHDFAGALSWGQGATALDAYSSQAWGVVGDALVELGRYPEAFRAMQRMVDLRPDLSSYSRASYAWELQGNVDFASRAMKLALGSASSSADAAWATNQLGELAFNYGHDLGKAQWYYRRAVEQDPAFVPPHAGLAKVEAARGRYRRAIRGYSWVVRRYPLPDYVMALGDLYTVDGQSAKAARQYALLRVEERLFRANGVNMDLEVALFDADHHVELAAGLAAARAEWGRRHSVFVADALAWELHANGDDREALRYSNLALHLGTRSALFLFHRGMIEKALGDRPAARTDLGRALSINPNFSILWSKPAARALASLGGAA